ncbi:DUF2889 domain-containing protein [Limobrevibacterium gyesilva]|uniref:DUF2889 domain-containing protein n=1 Tax=Limobrevibacterium gyesilva TaxID=2991712 RepID=A0AA42CIG7_9PROT|nr:DUF2889 domain-containing protein [Limobrevibacterium gyesilva]MCW3475907.1 DUF2889 domain-containing protein [Limobrevibacterium gyesilva]
MPLSEPVERERLHTRAIRIEGFRRSDGLYDIEAHLTDTKAYGFSSIDRGFIGPGEPLHEMWVRLTVDDRMVIVACEAATEHGPFTICGGGAASYASLVGLRIKPGFLKEANARIGGTAGCTHLRELLQQIATTAFQTMWPVRSKREAEAREQAAPSGKVSESDGSARLLNTCFAYASSGPVVRRRWPHLYTGPDAVHPEAPQLAAAESRED